MAEASPDRASIDREATDREAAVLDAWREPEDPAAALAYRPLAEALTGIACPLPIDPAEVEQHVAVARRNREYSAAHTDAMLPGDPPLLPNLLARAETLDTRERAAFADRLAERERRLAMTPDDVRREDVRLASALRALVLALPPLGAAVLCLRFGLGGDRPRSPHEVARLLDLESAAVRRHETDALGVLRGTGAVDVVRGVLDARDSPSPRAYP